MQPPAREQDRQRAPILVTGGAGYVGSHTCKALARAGYFPVTYDNLVVGHEWAVKWGPLERGDLQDGARLAEVIARWRPSAAIHFAAYAYVGESVTDPAKYYRNNVSGTLSLRRSGTALLIPLALIVALLVALSVTMIIASLGALLVPLALVVALLRAGLLVPLPVIRARLLLLVPSALLAAAAAADLARERTASARASELLDLLGRGHLRAPGLHGIRRGLGPEVLIVERDLDLDVADVDLVVQRDRLRALDPPTVDEGPVGRAEVGDDQLPARVDVEMSVVARDASLRDHEIIAGHAADPDLGLVVEALDPRRFALIRDPDSHGRSCGTRG
jgi:hypothetical protein